MRHLILLCLLSCFRVLPVFGQDSGADCIFAADGDDDFFLSAPVADNAFLGGSGSDGKFPALPKNLSLRLDRQGPADYFQTRPDAFAYDESKNAGKVFFSSASAQSPGASSDGRNLRLGLYFDVAPRRGMRIVAGADYFFLPEAWSSLDPSGMERACDAQSSSGQDDNWGSSVAVRLDF